LGLAGLHVEEKKRGLLLGHFGGEKKIRPKATRENKKPFSFPNLLLFATLFEFKSNLNAK
jgi:hypothetical protein